MKIKRKLRISIALIHNKEPKRYKHIRPMLDKLKDKLSPKYDVDIFEVLKEPDIIPHKILITLCTKFLYWKINREWMGYRGLKQRNIVIDWGLLIWRLILSFLNRAYENRRFVIESFVNDKHIRAWTQFLDKGGDYLICFEDDAFFRPDSIVNFKKFLSKLHISLEKPLYLDFAGGNSFDILKVDALQTKSDKYCKYFRKPVTNTACAYMINYKTAGIFLENILKRPWLRLISADWLLNKLFIITVPQYKYYSVHAYPHIFDHGSIKGNYASLYKSI